MTPDPDTGTTLLEVASHPAHPRLKEACARRYKARTGRDPLVAFKGLDLKAERFGRPARRLLEWTRDDAKLKGDELLDFAVLLRVGKWYPGSLATRAAWLMATLEGPLETDGNNLGSIIRELQRETDLDPGAWPWCAATVIAALHAAGWVDAAAFRASSAEAWVEAWDQAAKARRYGMRVVTPREAADTAALRSCIVMFRWDGDEVEDHIGMTLAPPNVARGTVETVEGNTSAGVYGSQADGGGLWRRTRSLSGTTLVAIAG